MYVQVHQTTSTGQALLFEVELIKGKLVVTKGDKVAAKGLLGFPIRSVTGKMYDAVKDPSGFLKHMCEEYSGSHMRATKPLERGV